MTEREIQDLLRDMREEPVPADSLARVRMGVDQRRRRVMPWKILAVLAVAVLLVGIWPAPLLKIMQPTIHHLVDQAVAHKIPQ